MGCFAKPEKLSRIFLRMVQSYSLGQIEGIELVNGGESGETEGTELLKALMAGKATWGDSVPPGTPDRFGKKIITGFFLALKDHRLELSIFAKNRHCRRETHLAALDGFTKVRQKRLN